MLVELNLDFFFENKNLYKSKLIIIDEVEDQLIPYISRIPTYITTLLITI